MLNPFLSGYYPMKQLFKDSKKNVILKDACEGNGPNSPIFQFFRRKLPDFYSKFQQSVEGYLKHFTFNI